jgi:hypothetical protein
VFSSVSTFATVPAELTLSVAQLVVTSRLAGPADRARFGAHGQVIRTGLRVPVLRQGWAPLAARHVLGGGRVDLVHVHCGEDVAVLPLAWLAARRHGCPLVATVHLSMRHALRPVTARGAAAGGRGAVEGWLLPGADAVIALTRSTARLLRGCVSGRQALSNSASVPGLIRRVVIQTKCSSTAASSGTGGRPPTPSTATSSDYSFRDPCGSGRGEAACPYRGYHEPRSRQDKAPTFRSARLRGGLCRSLITIA